MIRTGNWPQGSSNSIALSSNGKMTSSYRKCPTSPTHSLECSSPEGEILEKSNTWEIGYWDPRADSYELHLEDVCCGSSWVLRSMTHLDGHPFTSIVLFYDCSKPFRSHHSAKCIIYCFLCSVPLSERRLYIPALLNTPGYVTCFSQ